MSARDDYRLVLRDLVENVQQINRRMVKTSTPSRHLTTTCRDTRVNNLTRYNN